MSATVAPDGSWTVSIPLTAGANPIHAVVTSQVGRKDRIDRRDHHARHESDDHDDDDPTPTTPTTRPKVTAPAAPVQAWASPSGRLKHAALGPIKLGMTRAESRLGLSQFSPPNVYTDNPCLNGGYDIRVGYADRAIMPQGMRGGRLMGRIVLALTAAMACHMSSKPRLGAHDTRLWPRRHPRPRLTKH